jgi:mannose/fructose/N-acetylgalactosamine-specific phosphotransferase system component IIB
MGLDLFRIDERLLHGQVIVGWGMRLGIRRFVVVDDELATSEWEQELYASGLPETMSVEFLSVEDAIARFTGPEERSEREVVLTRSTAAMRALAEAGVLEGRRVNVGGLHSSASRSRALRYVHLTDAEADDLRTIARHARRVAARDLPESREVGLEELLRALG